MWNLCLVVAVLKWGDVLSFLFFNDFIYFSERGEGREKERERNINWLPLAGPQPRTLAHNPGTCPDWESNWWLFSLQAGLNLLSHTSQGRAMSFFAHTGKKLRLIPVTVRTLPHANPETSRGTAGNIIFSFFILFKKLLIFQLQLTFKYYFVLVSGVQHSG